MDVWTTSPRSAASVSTRLSCRVCEAGAGACVAAAGASPPGTPPPSVSSTVEADADGPVCSAPHTTRVVSRCPAACTSVCNAAESLRSDRRYSSACWPTTRTTVKHGNSRETRQGTSRPQPHTYVLEVVQVHQCRHAHPLVPEHAHSHAQLCLTLYACTAIKTQP